MLWFSEPKTSNRFVRCNESGAAKGTALFFYVSDSPFAGPVRMEGRRV